MKKTLMKHKKKIYAASAILIMGYAYYASVDWSKILNQPDIAYYVYYVPCRFIPVFLGVISGILIHMGLGDESENSK